MIKIVWLTDLHLVSDGDEPAGQDTALMNLRRCLSEVTKHHTDAARLVISGDLIQLGHNDAYEMLRTELARVQIPYRLLVGNHDDRAALLNAFPEIVPQEGFIQDVEDIGGVRIL